MDLYVSRQGFWNFLFLKWVMLLMVDDARGWLYGNHQVNTMLIHDIRWNRSFITHILNKAENLQIKRTLIYVWFASMKLSNGCFLNPKLASYGTWYLEANIEHSIFCIVALTWEYMKIYNSCFFGWKCSSRGTWGCMHSQYWAWHLLYCCFNTRVYEKYMVLRFLVGNAVQEEHGGVSILHVVIYRVKYALPYPCMTLCGNE
jgi:hypothetical protein